MKQIPLFFKTTELKFRRALFLLWRSAAPQFWLISGIRSSCRHLPSCSQYAEEALAREGWLRGSLLAGRRLLRCHPFAG